jgi:hypothetical protein
MVLEDHRHVAVMDRSGPTFDEVADVLCVVHGASWGCVSCVKPQAARKLIAAAMIR